MMFGAAVLNFQARIESVSLDVGTMMNKVFPKLAQRQRGRWGGADKRGPGRSEGPYKSESTLL